MKVSDKEGTISATALDLSVRFNRTRARTIKSSIRNAVMVSAAHDRVAISTAFNIPPRESGSANWYSRT
jgi:hypothetical protein